MRRLRTLATITAVLALGGAACGGDDQAGAGDGAASAAQGGAGGATVEVRSAGSVRFLVDGNGLTLYRFEQDPEGASTCFATCASAWPPLLSRGEPQAGAGVDPQLLGTVERRDGGRQVTYASMPLYHFDQDAEPGDANGQGVNGFGDLWWVVAPSGDAVTSVIPPDDERGSSSYGY